MKSLRKYCILLILLTICLSGYSQKAQDSTSKPKSKENYILSLDTVISLEFNIGNEHEHFEVKGDGFLYDLRPNISLSNCLSFSYRFIYFGIYYTPKFIPGNDDNKLFGKTKALSFGFSFTSGPWLQELQAARIKGFYMNNTADYITGWKEGTDPYIQFPNLRVKMIRGTTYYKFNPRYSLSAVRSQSQIQLKSCGSLIPSLSYIYHHIDNKETDTATKTSQKSGSFEAVATLGYAYTFVYKKYWYASLYVNPGIGAEYTRLTTHMPEGDYVDQYTDPVALAQLKAYLGYNSERFMAGIESAATVSSKNQRNTTVQQQSSRSYFQVFIGYRFSPPRIIKKGTDLIKETLPKKIQPLLE